MAKLFFAAFLPIGSGAVAEESGKDAEFASAQYARLYLGTAEPDRRAEQGVLRVELAATPDAPRRSRLLGVWGYRDYNLLDRDLGSNAARYPSVVVKVFVDGRLTAESPAMRISPVPWRFDVPIPPGSRQIVLVSDDAGSRSPGDLGNWVEAGFVLGKPS